MKINVLGSEYTISVKSQQEDKALENCDGYCDKTSRRIVVASKDADSNLDDFAVYQKKVIRHEIIHAFLFESGLHENWKHPEWGRSTTARENLPDTVSGYYARARYGAKDLTGKEADSFASGTKDL